MDNLQTMATPLSLLLKIKVFILKIIFSLYTQFFVTHPFYSNKISLTLSPTEQLYFVLIFVDHHCLCY